MKRLKKGMALLLSAMCIFTMSQVPGITAQAASTVTIEIGETKTIDTRHGMHNVDASNLSTEYYEATFNKDTGILTIIGKKATPEAQQLSFYCPSCSYLEDSPIYYNVAIEVKTKPAPAPSSNSASSTSSTTTPEHTHNFSWVTVQEVTTSQDGIEEYRCNCGMVEEKSVIPSSQVYVKGLYGAIKNAPQNGEAAFDSGKISTISDYIIKKLQERNDVKTVITFEYKNAKYKMTIPAGADYTKLLEDQDYFYGYFFFAGEVGATIETL